MKNNKIKIIGVILLLVLAVFMVGCESTVEDLKATHDADHELGEGPRDGNGTGLRDGTGAGNYGAGEYGEHDEHDGEGDGHGYFDEDGNTITAEELNLMDKTQIVVDDSMTLDEIATKSMIKVWHFVFDFSLPENVDTSKTILELNMEKDVNLDINEINDYIQSFEHGSGHHQEE